VVTIVLPLLIKIAVLFFLAILSFIVFSLRNLKDLFNVVYNLKFIYFSGSIWFLPALSTVFFMPVIKLGESLIKVFDQG